MNSLDSAAESQFEFRGTAREWFGIWIVNLLLSIVTLGIYSAWAKVRRKKYFHQHTYVAGRNFDYHATGMQILIGRIIVLVAYIVFSILAAIPIIGILMFLAIIAAVPFLIVRALRFNARMSSWSNVRFRFSGSYGKAALVYILYPILTALTLYTTWPVLSRASKRYSVSNHSLGNHAFSFSAPLAPFYKAFGVAILWVVAITAVLWVALIGDPSRFFTGTSDEPPVEFILGIYLWAFLAFFPAVTIYNAMVRNVTFNNLALQGGHRFRSDVIPGSLVWIAITNAVVTLCTLGLMLPWAQIRMARYLAMHTTFLPGGSLDDFVGEVGANAGPVGDAYADLEGVDFGLPI